MLIMMPYFIELFHCPFPRELSGFMIQYMMAVEPASDPFGKKLIENLTLSYISVDLSAFAFHGGFYKVFKSKMFFVRIKRATHRKVGKLMREVQDGLKHCKVSVQIYLR